MIKVAIVDLSAQSRQALLQEVGGFTHADEESLILIPRISLAPLSPQEVRFHEAPDVCIIGPDLVSVAPQDVSEIRKAIPESVILARMPAGMGTLAHVEHLARLGVDDILEEKITASQFLKKMILLKARRRERSSGRLILVDSGKGGLGVTSVVAGLGEALALSGKSTVLVDGDFETQDLSRFLQVRPFINENLRLLFDGQRSLSQESVQECVLPVWNGQLPLWCMSPANESEDLYQPQTRNVRTLLSILEVLDAKYDVVLVDLGCIRGEMRTALYRAADAVLFLVNNDPASLYASTDRIKKIRAVLGHDAGLYIVQNTSSRCGLPNKLLRQEFLRAGRLEPQHWCEIDVPYSKNGARWPASGATLYSQSEQGLIRALNAILSKLCLKQEERPAGLLGRLSHDTQSVSSHPPLLQALPARAPSEEQKTLPMPSARHLKQLEPHENYEESAAERLVSGVKFK